jgi:hypothetical protein
MRSPKLSFNVDLQQKTPQTTVSDLIVGKLLMAAAVCAAFVSLLT